MRILIFNWRCWHHPLAGGAEKYLYEISKRLVKKGYKITWFVSRFCGAREKEFIDGIEVIRKGGKFSVYLYAFWHYLMHLRKKNFDLIIDDINGVPFFTPIYVWRHKIAIIHHLVKKIFFRELPWHMALLGWISERLIPLIYFNTKFVTVSKSSEEEMKKFGIKNIEIVPNGIDTKIYNANPNSKNDIPVILFLGRLKKYKRIELLLRSFKIVSKKVEAELWIAGRGDMKGELENLTKELEIQDRVKFFGFVSEKDKIELLKKAWVFVTTSEKEGWGITVIEANACGTPAIAFNVSGLRDSIKHGYSGLLVEDGNIEKLAEAIIDILSDSDLREELSRNAIEWAKRFSWDRSAEEFEKVIKNVIGER